jgi:hypothetical protein
MEGEGAEMILGQGLFFNFFSAQGHPFLAIDIAKINNKFSHPPIMRSGVFINFKSTFEILLV